VQGTPTNPCTRKKNLPLLLRQREITKRGQQSSPNGWCDEDDQKKQWQQVDNQRGSLVFLTYLDYQQQCIHLKHLNKQATRTKTN
jgi:hypothetical protein